MALQKTIKISGNASFRSGLFNIENIEIEKEINSYIKISNINGNKNNIEFIISYFNGDIQIGTDKFNFTPFLDGDNFIKQAYLHLKSLPEFADAVDC